MDVFEALCLSLIFPKTFYQQRLSSPSLSFGLLRLFPSPPLFSLRKKIGICLSLQDEVNRGLWSSNGEWFCLFGLHPHSVMWSHMPVKAAECTICCPSTGPQTLGYEHSRTRNVYLLPSCWDPWPDRRGARIGLQLLLQPNSFPFSLLLAVRLMKQAECSAHLYWFFTFQPRFLLRVIQFGQNVETAA